MNHWFSFFLSRFLSVQLLWDQPPRYCWTLFNEYSNQMLWNRQKWKNHPGAHCCCCDEPLYNVLVSQAGSSQNAITFQLRMKPINFHYLPETMKSCPGPDLEDHQPEVGDRDEGVQDNFSRNSPAFITVQDEKGNLEQIPVRYFIISY